MRAQRFVSHAAEHRRCATVALISKEGMNFDQIIRGLGSLTFRQAVWLFPVAYVLQVFAGVFHVADVSHNVFKAW